MKNHYNVIHKCLLERDPETLVLHIIPPPELHLLMVVVNHLLEVIRLHMMSLNREYELWDWMDTKGISRRGYHGKNRLDGQNSDQLFKNLVKLRESALIPDECLPLLDVLENFNVVKESCFSLDLKEDYRGKLRISLFLT